MAGQSLSYRPDIDGLRAIAVMGVLVFHLNESWLGGGYVGVDVFFVISGFLMTSIIQRNLEKGSFSIIQFYERRIRRIVPALFVMFLVVSLLASNILLPNDLLDYAKSLKYALFSVSNFHFLRTAEDYFHSDISQMPLLHTWSLSIEEQFYVIHPMVMIMGNRYLKSRRGMMILVAIVGLVSLLLSQWVVSRTPEKAFYLIPWRAWELLLGSFIALARLPERPGRMDPILGIAGLGMVLGSIFTFDSSTVFPGYSAAIPCMGAALLIYSGRLGKGIVAHVLSRKPFVFVGLISYSLYLWHWPLITFCKYVFPYNSQVAVGIGLLSIILGFLSWRFVEKPFRNPSAFGRKTIFAFWSVASIAFLATAIGLTNADGLPGRFSGEVTRYLNVKAGSERPRSINAASDQYDASRAPVFGSPSATPTIAVWGDSHAGALLPVLDLIAKEAGKSFISYDMPGQPPMTEVTQLGKSSREKRDAYSKAVLKILVSDDRIQTVILHARWGSYANGGNPARTGLPQLLYKHPFKTVSEQETYIEQRLTDAVNKLVAARKRVVIVYPVPEPGIDVPSHFAKLAASSQRLPDEIYYGDYDRRNRKALDMLDSLMTLPQVETIRPDKELLREGWLKIQSDGKPLFCDKDHLSAAGALLLRRLLGSVFGNP